MSEADHRVSVERLRRSYDPAELGFETTADLEPLEGLTGQDRALAALRFGLGMESHGFNVYAAGPHGIGKMTALREILGDLAASRPAPPDVCYVHNFEDPYKPRALVLPDGKGRQLRQDMEQLLLDVISEVPRAFGSDEYRAARVELERTLDTKRREFLKALDKRAGEVDFAIKLTPVGVSISPELGDHALTEKEVEALPENVRDDIHERGEGLKEYVRDTLKNIHLAECAARKTRDELDREVALYAIRHLLDAVVERYAEFGAVGEYLEQVREGLLELADEIRELEPSEEPTWKRGTPREFQVNLLVDKAKGKGAPVVVELNPAYASLFGKIEKEGEVGGVFSTDFTMIRPGSIHRANGGYLVIPVLDLLRNTFSWDALKRAIRSGEVEVEDPAERLGLISTKSLRPDPVPLDLKIVLVGPPIYYYLLHRHDPDFRELFKVKADFDTRMEASDEHVSEFLRFLRGFCQSKDCTLPLDAAAAARLLEHSTRLAGDQEKLSTLFGELCDVVREAEFWAKEEGTTLIGRAHVEKALEQKRYRDSLTEERIQELISEGTLRIHTEGQATGQVNGLAVLQLGDYRFGRPCRISASVACGREGIVDIERKVELGGAIHSKGVMIIHGYLLQTYGAERPLTLSARLAFEQSYNEVDGDSASSAELYALISALSETPLAQGIAVTGSVDQHGRVQAVGGINEKIEGFYRVCAAANLSGEQGVIIPRSNARHLMLATEVVEAVREGRFHVWSVETVDQGLEILSGKAPRAIHEAANARLETFAEGLRKLAAEPDDSDEGELVLPATLQSSARPSSCS